MRARAESSESGVVLAVVLMVLAALSLLAVAGKGDVALQWLQVRNAREYAEAIRLAETGVGMALSAERFRLDAPRSGRYCRIASRCVEWTVRHVETTAVPAGFEKAETPKRALHFEIGALGTAGPRARAPVVVGFMLLARGEADAELPDEIEICRKEDDCPEDSAEPPVRRYWREEVE
ncbi:MAG: hypothetical protein OXI11_09575 [Gammaproteobacteria bacterium]|nr:hypothetical protein [Gammaproteobacteria bacterium]MXW46440.1 hypothetical protein [Gammaproteobacteria bacterium]MYD02111.1 hypothetical protein [Gammaproteobacteria bacterium]MYI24576.1 hypothetical protein [Gammaproteobacteria bacterium]